MKVEILGPGCPKCERTTQMIEETMKETGVDVQVEHVTDINEIVDRGVMMTPAVIVDGKVKIEGKVPAVQEVKKWLDG